jgi:hypothetical protein
MGSLHKLFKKKEIRELTDGENTVKVMIRSLTNSEEMHIQDVVRRMRDEGRKLYDTEDAREGFFIARRAQDRETVIKAILAADRRVGVDLTDLAPNGSSTMTDEEREIAEKEALDRLEAARRLVLEQKVDAELVTLMVDRDIAQAVASHGTQTLLDESMCVMILDPDTGEQQLSNDPKAENWIGNLDTQTRMLLTQLWNTLQGEKSQKILRMVAENPTSSSRGVLAKNSENSHGETETTLSTSPRTS